MSTAKVGDGKIRAAVKEATRDLRVIVDRLGSILEDEARVRNNLDVETAEEALDVNNQIKEILTKTNSIFERAIKHHSAQVSVVPNNIFGQKRRIKNGVVTVIGDFDNAKFAERCKQDNFGAMTTAERATYMMRGENPPEGFFKLSKAEQRDYLRGKTDLNTR